MNKIIVMGGPTAVGKTEYAIGIAKSLGGEIVSCDSMQLYKYMDIGSAKPDKEELASVKHHLIDAVDPTEDFSVAKYQVMARNAIDDILSRGLIPIVTGGTGLYINSIIYDMDFSSASADMKLRNELQNLASEKGSEFVYNMLKEEDPEAAERIHPNNTKKVIRAIEACRLGNRIGDFKNDLIPYEKYDPIMFALTRDREELYDRINRRVDILLEKGLIDEVRRLQNMGLDIDDISMKGIGYKEVLAYLDGEYDSDFMLDLIKKNTRHYAKRQLTWLRRYEDMKFFNLSEYDDKEKALEDILLWLKKRL